MRAVVIAIEGPDAVGKGTQVKRVAEALRARGLRVTTAAHSHDAHPWGEKAIYSMLDSGAAVRHPITFQLVHFANRMFYQWYRLPKLRCSNDVVILDRWSLSGYVYGTVTGVPRWLNRWLYNRAVRPNMTVVLLGRAYPRGASSDSYERDTQLQSLSKALYARAATDWPRHVAVYGNGDPASTCDAIVSLLRDTWAIICPP